MGRLWIIAIRNLLQQRRRTLLLGGAVSLVTVLLVLLMGISGGMQATILRSATTLMTGHVNVGGFYKMTSSSRDPVLTSYRAIEEVVREAIPELDYMVDRVRGWGKISSEKSSQNASVHGIDVNRERRIIEVVEVVSGDVRDLAEPRTALIFEKQAERLEVAVGDMLTVSAPTFKGVRNSIDVRVAAIAKDVGYISGFAIYVPTNAVRELYQLSEEATGALMLYLDDRKDTADVFDRVREALRAAGYTLMEHEALPMFAKLDSVSREDWTGQRLDVTTWEDETSFLSLTIAGFDTLAGMLVSILLIIIVVGIMNTLFMAIRERTGEIGTLRAIGMQRGRVMVMFLIEAFVLTTAATLVGTALGVGLVLLINAANIELANEAMKVFLMSDTLVLQVEVWAVLRAMSLVVLFCSLFAFIPAWRAARLSPVSAMQAA